MTKRILCVCLIASSAALNAASGVSNPTAPTEQQCRDILESALKDKNPDVRKQAAVALSLVGSRAPYLSLVDSVLEDKDVEVRLAAVASMVDMRSKSSVAALHKALKDPVPEVSFAAAKALWGLGDLEGRAALMAVLSRETKTSSNFLTKQMRDTLRLMHTPKGIFMFAVKQGIGFAPVPGAGEGVASMQALLSDPGVSGRAAAALLLGREKDPEILAALRDALTDRDWSVRAAAVHALAVQNNPALLSAIAPLLDDKKEAVRLRAAAASIRLETVRPSRKTSGPRAARHRS